MEKTENLAIFQDTHPFLFLFFTTLLLLCFHIIPILRYVQLYILLLFMKYSLGTLALTCVTSSAFNIESFFRDLNVSDKDSIVEIGQRMLTNIKTNSLAYLAEHDATASEYPYFNFLPMFRAGVVPDSKTAVSFSAKCFPEHSAVANTGTDGTISVTITSSGEPATDSCYDSFWLMTVTGLVTVKIESVGEF